MEYIKVSGLPFEASRIALGTWAIGGWMWGGTEEKDAIATIHHALECGINLIDTAPASTASASPKRSSARHFRAGAIRR